MNFVGVDRGTGLQLFPTQAGTQLAGRRVMCENTNSDSGGILEQAGLFFTPMRGTSTPNRVRYLPALFTAWNHCCQVFSDSELKWKAANRFDPGCGSRFCVGACGGVSVTWSADRPGRSGVGYLGPLALEPPAVQLALVPLENPEHRAPAHHAAGHQVLAA